MSNNWIEDAQVWLGDKWASLKGGEYKNAFDIMNNWNKLKLDMYQGGLIPEYGIKDGTDNLCRIGAGIEIGQKAAKLRAEGKNKEADELINSCLELSSLREKADTVRKKWYGGDNKDADKDEKNIRRGIEIGLKNPNADVWKTLSELDMKSEAGEFINGYNNGFADFIKEHYHFGEDYKPIFTKEQGSIISDLIKGNVCKDLNEALAFMERHPDDASNIIRMAKGLQSSGKYSFSDALAIYDKEIKNNTDKMPIRDTMRKDRQNTTLMAQNSSAEKTNTLSKNNIKNTMRRDAFNAKQQGEQVINFFKNKIKSSLYNISKTNIYKAVADKFFER